jgi:hypothetical protein
MMKGITQVPYRMVLACSLPGELIEGEPRLNTRLMEPRLV